MRAGRSPQLTPPLPLAFLVHTYPIAGRSIHTRREDFVTFPLTHRGRRVLCKRAGACGQGGGGGGGRPRVHVYPPRRATTPVPLAGLCVWC